MPDALGRLPGAVEPAAAGDLVVGGVDGALRGAGACGLGEVGVGAGGRGRDDDVGPEASRARPAPPAGRVRRAAGGPGRGRTWLQPHTPVTRQYADPHDRGHPRSRQSRRDHRASRAAHDGRQAGRLPAPASRGGGRARRGGAREGRIARPQERPRAHRDPARRRLLRRARRPGPSPQHRVRPGEEAPDRRRRRHRLRHHRRPPGLRLRPGLLHLRRQPRRGVRREDRQGHGSRDQERLPDHRHQRGRRRAHPGGRRLARPVRRDLQAQRVRVRRGPADQPHHGLVRRRTCLLPRRHRLHDHGRRHVEHVHHRPGHHQDGHRRGRHDGGARRRPHPQHPQRQRALHGLGRGRRDRVRQGSALVPPAEQHGGARAVRRGCRPRAR